MDKYGNSYKYRYSDKYKILEEKFPLVREKSKNFFNCKSGHTMMKIYKGTYA